MVIPRLHALVLLGSFICSSHLPAGGFQSRPKDDMPHAKLGWATVKSASAGPKKDPFLGLPTAKRSAAMTDALRRSEAISPASSASASTAFSKFTPEGIPVYDLDDMRSYSKQAPPVPAVMAGGAVIRGRSATSPAADAAAGGYTAYNDIPFAKTVDGAYITPAQSRRAGPETLYCKQPYPPAIPGAWADPSRLASAPVMGIPVPSAPASSAVRDERPLTDIMCKDDDHDASDAAKAILKAFMAEVLLKGKEITRDRMHAEVLAPRFGIEIHAKSIGVVRPLFDNLLTIRRFFDLDKTKFEFWPEETPDMTTAINNVIEAFVWSIISGDRSIESLAKPAEPYFTSLKSLEKAAAWTVVQKKLRYIREQLERTYRTPGGKPATVTPLYT